MTKTRKHFYLTKEIIKIIEDNAKAQGIKESHFIENLVQGKTEETPTLKEIVTKYEGICKKCNTYIPIGVRAYWSKGVIICANCYVEAMSSKALFKKYLKSREFDKINKETQKQINEKLNYLRELEIKVQFAKFMQRLNMLLNLGDQFLRNLDDSTAKELKEFLTQLKQELPEMKVAITTKIIPLKHKKKVKKVRYEY